MNADALLAHARRRLDRSAAGPLLLGVAVIGAVFGGFFGWAQSAPLASAAVAPGLVEVEGRRKQVKHLEGGSVAELLVREGDFVHEGQTLLRLDPTKAEAAAAILQAKLDAAAALEARLTAERDGAAAVAFPEALVARRAEAEVAEILRGQQALFEARRASLEGQSAVLRQRIAQLDEDIVGLREQRKAKERQILLIAEELKALSGLFAKGYAERPRILALEREQAKLDGERAELISEVARTQQAIGEAELQILQLETRFREEVAGGLRDARDERFDLEERLAAARHLLERTVVRATATGAVVGLNAHTVGGVIKPGDVILEIVPRGERLLVRAEVRPLDIDSVAAGQEAEVRILAFRPRSAPTLHGRVTQVSADSLSDPHTGRPFYLAEIELPDTELARLGSLRIQPGMPADVLIKTGERTALAYLTQPVLESFNRAWREN
jgi:HlyD family secretion protein/epimerase transport system membrane fusion protein